MPQRRQIRTVVNALRRVVIDGGGHQLRLTQRDQVGVGLCLADPLTQVIEVDFADQSDFNCPRGAPSAGPER